ncbi:unnamed protein product [Closterium sp. NIES-65]|nr:unnamed protein product [Closterium sp. NIES-65]
MPPSHLTVLPTLSPHSPPHPLTSQSSPPSHLTVLPTPSPHSPHPLTSMCHPLTSTCHPLTSQSPPSHLNVPPSHLAALPTRSPSSPLPPPFPLLSSPQSPCDAWEQRATRQRHVLTRLKEVGQAVVLAGLKDVGHAVKEISRLLFSTQSPTEDSSSALPGRPAQGAMRRRVLPELKGVGEVVRG